MKIDIWLNNLFINHNKPIPKKIENISLKHFKRAVKSEDHLYILRGEPTLHPNFLEILKTLQGKNFIVSTHGLNSSLILNKKENIPYITIKWDGIRNDVLKGDSTLTYNIFKLLDFFSNREDIISRIEYTITNKNIDWFSTDIATLRKLYSVYNNMKQPYFVINQQSEVLNQNEYTFVPFGADHLDMLNRTGLLTQKNLDYLKASIDKKDYICKSLQDEMVLNYDGTFRTCQSLRFHEELGNIEDNTIEEIIKSSEKYRESLERCPLRAKCWLAYHYKDNIAKSKQIYDI
jgi:MoaA/NifB/PqqE/SkfB family radical SAM enzyme